MPQQRSQWRHRADKMQRRHREPVVEGEPAADFDSERASCEEVIREIRAKMRSQLAVENRKPSSGAQVGDRMRLRRSVHVDAGKANSPLHGCGTVGLACAEHDRDVDLITGLRVEGMDEDSAETWRNTRTEQDRPSIRNTGGEPLEVRRGC